MSDFFGKKESVNANVGTTTAFDEQPAQSGTAVLALVLKGSTINGGSDSEVYSQLPAEDNSRRDIKTGYVIRRDKPQYNLNPYLDTLLLSFNYNVLRILSSPRDTGHRSGRYHHSITTYILSWPLLPWAQHWFFTLTTLPNAGSAVSLAQFWVRSRLKPFRNNGLL